MTTYEGLVTVRYLRDDERSPLGAGRDHPLVIEPNQRSDVEFLANVLAEHSEDVKKSLFQHGAILFRGFRCRDAHDFERIMLSVRGFRPMSGYFMAEPGRELIAGTKHVFDTNAKVRSGGDFRFGGFHSENYYTLDVPHIQAFCCLRPPWLGGETALVHMANAYREFDDDIRTRLEAKSCRVGRVSLASVAARYGVAEETLERFFELEHVQVVTSKSNPARKWIVVQKPSVYRHPVTKMPSLQVNLSSELPAVNEMALAHFLPGYKGAKWFVHRLAWRHKNFRLFLSYVSHLPRAVHHPSLLGSFIMRPIVEQVSAMRKGHAPQPQKSAAPGPRLKDFLKRRHVQTLADAVWRHSSVFPWQQGDVIVLDNLQMLHAGMPGVGPRVIRVMMCNPVPIQYPITAGIATIADLESIESHRSLHERLVEVSQSSLPVAV